MTPWNGCLLFSSKKQSFFVYILTWIRASNPVSSKANRPKHLNCFQRVMFDVWVTMLIDFIFSWLHSSCLKVMTDCSLSVDSIIAWAVTLSLRNVVCCDGVTGGVMLCLPYDLTTHTCFPVFFSLWKPLLMLRVLSCPPGVLYNQFLSQADFEVLRDRAQVRLVLIIRLN